MSSSKAFIVSSLSFRSLIHFGFALEHGVRECSVFIFPTLLSSRSLALGDCVSSSVSFVPRCWGDCLLCVICPTLLGGLCLLLCVALSWADSRVSCLVSGPCCMQSSSSRVESCLLSVSLLTALSDFDMGAVLIPGLLRLGPQAQGRQDGPCLSRGTPGASAAEESRCSVYGR